MKKLLLIFALCFVQLSADTDYSIVSSNLLFPYQHCPLYCPWKNDEDFLKLLQTRGEGYGYEDDLPSRYLQYILSRNALSLKGGDFIECGVQNGQATSIFAAVLDLWDSQNRSIYGFDTFEGLPAPTIEDLDALSGGHFFCQGALKGLSKKDVENNLLKFQCPREIIQGLIPESFAGYEDKKFCFAHIDVDLYNSTMASLAFVYPRMLKGGIILFDDYGFHMCKGAKDAIDEYLSDKPEVLIKEPIGRAYMIKQ